MADLDDFRSRVSRKIGLTNSVAGEQGDIDAWVNEGVTDFVLRTKCKVESGTTTLAAGEQDFTVDTDILLIEALYLQGSDQNYPAQMVSLHDILQMRQAFVVTGIGPLYYALAGPNLITVHPPPSSTITLVIYYVPRPVLLTDGAHTPDEIPEEFHKAVELFALAEAADFDDDASSKQGDRYREEYERWVLRARALRNMKGGSRLPSARLARRRYAFGRREDVYP